MESAASNTIAVGSAMAQAVSRRPLTAEARFRSRVSPCGICGGQSGTGTGFFPVYIGFPLSVSYHQCSVLIFIYALLLPEGQTYEAWEPSRKRRCFGNQGVLD
jgi:hypothetical protein